MGYRWRDSYYDPPDDDDEPTLYGRIEEIEEMLNDARTSGLRDDAPDSHAPRDKAIRDALWAFAEDEYVQKMLADVRKATRAYQRRMRSAKEGTNETH